LLGSKNGLNKFPSFADSTAGSHQRKQVIAAFIKQQNRPNFFGRFFVIDIFISGRLL
jgi:hypothetical protein